MNSSRNHYQFIHYSVNNVNCSVFYATSFNENQNDNYSCVMKKPINVAILTKSSYSQAAFMSSRRRRCC